MGMNRDEANELSRYFHNHLILNYHFFVSAENILLLDQKTEAVLSSAGEKQDQVFLLLVRYPDDKWAAGALQSFARAYMPDAAEPGLVESEDKKWTAVKRKGYYVAVVFEARSASSAKNTVAEIAEKIPSRIELIKLGWQDGILI